MILVLSHCLKCSKGFFFFSKHLLVRRRDSIDMLPAMSKMLLAVGETATFVCFPSLFSPKAPFLLSHSYVIKEWMLYLNLTNIV